MIVLAVALCFAFVAAAAFVVTRSRMPGHEIALTGIGMFLGGTLGATPGSVLTLFAVVSAATGAGSHPWGMLGAIVLVGLAGGLCAGGMLGARIAGRSVTILAPLLSLAGAGVSVLVWLGAMAISPHEVIFYCAPIMALAGAIAGFSISRKPSAR